MGTIQNLSQQCLRGFQDLLSSLKNTRPEFLELMPESTIVSELGNLRIWCGNLGALQTGYASLDYRLRESAVMQSNISKLLQQLNTVLKESIAVTSGVRLPFDEQSVPSDVSDEESASESDIDDGPELKELSVRVSSIADIQRNLYQLGYKIRDPSTRPTSTKATWIRQIDDETNVDLFDKLYEFDKGHVTEFFDSIRQGRKAPDNSHDALLERLTSSNTLRRKYFNYWKKHAEKLNSRADSLIPVPQLAQVSLSDRSKVEDNSRVRQEQLALDIEQQTYMSKTDATPYDPAKDNETEKGTVISTSSTAIDADGKGVDIPKAPAEAIEGKPFACPYCAVLCPPKQGRTKGWKAHVLYDLQPYVCTYENCTRGNELYRSRKRWVEHEETAHRCSWRCRDHPDVLYATSDGLRSHFLLEHDRSLNSEQVDDLLRISTVGRADDRGSCPICFEQQPFSKGLTNHLANHLERIALFALPMTVLEDSNDQKLSQSSKMIMLGSQCSTSPPLEERKGKEVDTGSTTGSNRDLDWDMTDSSIRSETEHDSLQGTLNLIKDGLNQVADHVYRKDTNLTDLDYLVLEAAQSETHQCLSLMEKLYKKRLHANGQLPIKAGKAISQPLHDIRSFLAMIVQNLSRPWENPLTELVFSSTSDGKVTSAVSALGAIGTLCGILEGVLDILSGSISFTTGMNKIKECQSILEGIWFVQGSAETLKKVTEDEGLDLVPRTSGDAESLDPRYRAASSEEFQPGEVFFILWPEPAGPDPDPETAEEIRYRDSVFLQFRRFIVVANDVAYCICVPFSTYGRQGLRKADVKARPMVLFMKPAVCHALYPTSQKPDTLRSESTYMKKACVSARKHE
ncbi:hypothetical protein FSARC_10560 [Fusarium sarcochroum]|uniref:C2H2-type domain-containing protein n=1 Tax=Fusarium sarcochroum TaxID=1208366 RepID=A0A8H4X3I3_9HYPO|nr:hypothetical protein FSARC_10560 [Fusarium sarcochroum]